MKNKEEQLELFKRYNLREITFTKIAVFMRCPKEYWHRFLNKSTRYDPQGQEILEGRLLHKLAEDYLRLPLLERNSEVLIEYVYSHSGLYRKVKRKNEIIDTVRLFDKSCLRTLKEVRLEMPFKTKMDGFILKGRADCLASDNIGWILFDFKRDESDLEHLQTDIDKYLQLIFYYLGLELHKPEKSKNIRFSYYFLLNGKADTIEPPPSFMESGLSRILEIDSHIRSADSFPAKVTRLCYSCIVGKVGKCYDFKKYLTNKGGTNENS